MLKHVELEWKILALAFLLLLGFAWPVNRLFVSRFGTMLQQSVDPQLEPLLRAELESSQGNRRDSVVASLERDRQWRALIPILVREQRYAVLSLSLFLFVVLGIFAFWSLRRLTRPLKNLAVAVKRIGRGERAPVAVVSGGALGTVEEAVVSLQDELDVLRERARIQGMESAWRDIAGVMAHEIKNPLTPIRLALDRLEEKAAGGGVDTATLRTHLDRMNEQVDALERLVDQFRSFSRDTEVQYEKIDITGTVRAVADTMSPGLSTVIRGNAQASADPRMLSQVLLNLLKNSLEAGAGRIEVTVAHDTTGIVVTMTDDGPGIPPENIARVWLPYVTFKKGGTGLGLPVVKRMVESMGGTVSLSSETGGAAHGTCVVLRLRQAATGTGGK